MTIKPSPYCVAAVFAASAAAFCASAGAQSLTMSLRLDPVSAPVQEKAPTPVIDRCSGHTWASRLGVACRSEPFASGAAASVTEATLSGDVSEPVAGLRRGDENGAGDSFSGVGLPTLGSLSAARLLQAAREVPVQAGKAVDLLFRFASKYRLVNAEQGWEVVKFKDVTSENRTQASGVKGLGVELLFPFE